MTSGMDFYFFFKKDLHLEVGAFSAKFFVFASFEPKVFDANRWVKRELGVG